MSDDIGTYSLSEFADAASLISHYSNLHPAGLCVDLGCGYYKPRGFIGIDDLRGRGTQVENPHNLPDIYMNLDRGRIPLPDQSCIRARASHFLEHSNVPHILAEVHRLLKPGGIFEITVPYANSAEGMYPGHAIFFTEKWFHLNIQFQNLFTIEDEKFIPSDIYEQLPKSIKAIPFALARQIFFNVCCEMSIIAKTRRAIGAPSSGP